MSQMSVTPELCERVFAALPVPQRLALTGLQIPVYGDGQLSHPPLARVAWVFDFLERLGAKADDWSIAYAAFAIDSALCDVVSDNRRLVVTKSGALRYDLARPADELSAVAKELRSGHITSAYHCLFYLSPAAHRAIAMAADGPLGLPPDPARLAAAVEKAIATLSRGGRPDKAAAYIAAATIECAVRGKVAHMTWLSADRVRIYGVGPELFEALGERYGTDFTTSVIKNVRSRLPKHPMQVFEALLPPRSEFLE